MDVICNANYEVDACCAQRFQLKKCLLYNLVDYYADAITQIDDKLYNNQTRFYDKSLYYDYRIEINTRQP